MERGDLVVASFNNPREQLWGVLIRLDHSGVAIRGIELGNFEEWCRQLAGKDQPQLGLETIFFPAHRVERVSLDERIGTVPSFQERFQEIVGKDPRQEIAINNRSLS